MVTPCLQSYDELLYAVNVGALNILYVIELDALFGFVNEIVFVPILKGL